MATDDAILLRTTFESKQTQHAQTSEEKNLLAGDDIKSDSHLCNIQNCSNNYLYIEYQRLDRLRERQKKNWDVEMDQFVSYDMRSAESTGSMHDGQVNERMSQSSMQSL